MFKDDKSQIICIVLFIILFGILIHAYTNKGKLWGEEEYYYGPVINRICESEEDCISIEGKRRAEQKCVKEITSDPMYGLFRSACESQDREIFENGCPDDCDADNVPNIYLEGGNYKSMLGCKEPLQLGMDRSTGDQLCVGKNGMWMMYKKKKQLDEEKKAAAEKAAAEKAAAEKAAAEKAASTKLEVKEPFQY